jgi:hypothetical protein
MNQRIQKIDGDIERTKAKITELQALLPELERKKTDLENTEIVRLVRSANVAPGDIAAFIESMKKPRQESRANDGRFPRNDSAGPGGAAPSELKQEEASKNEEA